tara:strand:- start:19533 stop:19838 length:306 start_codon:yes stop_codon:yes gene_type:complete
MSLLFWPQRKPIATFDTSKYDVSYPGMGVVIARAKSSESGRPSTNPSSKKSSTRSYASGVDDGKGPAMSEDARTKFIRGKNPGYVVKKTKQGATYGVRQIV